MKSPPSHPPNAWSSARDTIWETGDTLGSGSLGMSKLSLGVSCLSLLPGHSLNEQLSSTGPYTFPMMLSQSHGTKQPCSKPSENAGKN